MVDIHDLFDDEGEERFIEDSGWLEDGADIDNIYDVFEDKYRQAVTFLVARLGKPLDFCDEGPGRLSDSNPALIKWSTFLWNDTCYAIGYGHHDRETPVFLWSQQVAKP